jgi:hypothetical protein
MAREFVVAFALLTGDWQPLLIIPPKQCSNLFFFPLPLPLALSRLLQWRLLRHALTLRTTVSEMASTAFELLMVAASMLTALQPPIVICHSERACE